MVLETQDNLTTTERAVDELQLALDAIYAVISILQPDSVAKHVQLNRILK